MITLTPLDAPNPLTTPPRPVAYGEPDQTTIQKPDVFEQSTSMGSGSPVMVVNPYAGPTYTAQSAASSAPPTPVSTPAPDNSHVTPFQKAGCGFLAALSLASFVAGGIVGGVVGSRFAPPRTQEPTISQTLPTEAKGSSTTAPSLAERMIVATPTEPEPAEPAPEVVEKAKPASAPQTVVETVKPAPAPVEAEEEESEAAPEAVETAEQAPEDVETEAAPEAEEMVEQPPQALETVEPGLACVIPETAIGEETAKPMLEPDASDADEALKARARQYIESVLDIDGKAFQATDPASAPPAPVEKAESAPAALEPAEPTLEPDVADADGKAFTAETPGETETPTTTETAEPDPAPAEKSSYEEWLKDHPITAFINRYVENKQMGAQYLLPEPARDHVEPEPSQEPDTETPTTAETAEPEPAPAEKYLYEEWARDHPIVAAGALATTSVETVRALDIAGHAISLGNQAHTLGAAAQASLVQAQALGGQAQMLGQAAKTAAAAGHLQQAASLGQQAQVAAAGAKAAGAQAMQLGSQAKATGAKAMNLGDKAKGAAHVAKALSIFSGSIAVIDGVIDIGKGVQESNKVEELKNVANGAFDELTYDWQAGEYTFNDLANAALDLDDVTQQLNEMESRATQREARGGLKTFCGGLLIASPFTGPAAIPLAIAGGLCYLIASFLPPSADASPTSATSTPLTPTPQLVPEPTGG